MKLYFNDDVTPPDYHPTGFMEAKCEEFFYDDETVNIKVRLRIKVRSHPARRDFWIRTSLRSTCLLFRFQCTTNVSRTYIQASELGLALMLMSLRSKLSFESGEHAEFPELKPV